MESLDILNAAVKFNEKINQRDLDGLAEMMTEDHAFIDSEGTVTRGKQVMRDDWAKFFEQFPDYKNIFNTVTVQNDVAVMVGYSVCSEKKLSGPNIWTAKAVGKRISEWRVYWLDKR
jgi:ketosteroid isomerase-like protein